jgi:hypothetical protein
MAALFALLLIRRRQLLKASSANERWDELTAVLTFAPIIVGCIATIIYLCNLGNWSSTSGVGAFAFPSSGGVLFPGSSGAFLGFGAWGTVALVFVNGVWQFIDISSLQRLQSLDKDEVSVHSTRVVQALRTTGFEAGVGWVLIALTAGLLNASGITVALFGASGFSNETFGNLLHTALAGKFAILVPVFVFTAVVYMLSTISGFISAISYISFYDIVPAITRAQPTETGDLKTKLHAARATTVVVIVALFLLYLLLRAMMAAAGNAGAIGTVLYAIYAFQIAIAPSAIVALFWKGVRVSPAATILSVSAGLWVAYSTALNPNGWMQFEQFGMDAASWNVIPPLASALAASLTYVVVSALSWPFVRRSPRRP